MKTEAVLLVVILGVWGLCVPAHADPWPGAGTAESPYLIYDANDMQAIGADSTYWNANFKLMADIDLSIYTGTEFNTIGFLETGKPFSGVFEGNGHIIANFSYTSTGIDNVGLFGFIEDGQIRNLGLVNVNIDATGDTVGGLVGYNSNGSITKCYTTGNIQGGDFQTGGLVGVNSGTVANCYSTATVSGKYYVGGLVGRNSGYGIANCYATGNLNSSVPAGGLVGVGGAPVHLSYWDIQTTGQSTSAGGTGKTTAEMMSLDTYQGWGYESAWILDEGVDYPRLVWENKHGELITDEPRTYGGGSGTLNNPYRVFTVEHLSTLSWCLEDLDKHFVLMDDIDFSTSDPNHWNVIGNAVGFSGSFDGNGKTLPIVKTNISFV